MDTPEANPEGYSEASVLQHLEKGVSPEYKPCSLKLTHGTGDDNVHYQAMEMLINELVKHGKMFSMMTYPMRTHGISEREGTTMHLYNTMLKYWLENL